MMTNYYKQNELYINTVCVSDYIHLQYKWPRYNWHIVESGAKHHKSLSLSLHLQKNCWFEKCIFKNKKTKSGDL